MRRIIICLLFLAAFLAALFCYYTYILADSITSVISGPSLNGAGS